MFWAQVGLDVLIGILQIIFFSSSSNEDDEMHLYLNIIKLKSLFVCFISAFNQKRADLEGYWYKYKKNVLESPFIEEGCSLKDITLQLMGAEHLLKPWAGYSYYQVLRTRLELQKKLLPSSRTPNAVIAIKSK